MVQTWKPIRGDVGGDHGKNRRAAVSVRTAGFETASRLTEQQSCCMPQGTYSGVHEPVHIQGAGQARHDWKYIPAGSFVMGSEDDDARPEDGEGPLKTVRMDAFYMNATATTNDQFRQFVTETGYTTQAETYGWSYVFKNFLAARAGHKLASTLEVKQVPWWIAVKRACWHKPEGPRSSIKDRMNHPVVHISWIDAQAYCQWADCRLPTEVEWEYAARGGLENMRFPWGNELTPNGVHQCNIWQGKFPVVNTGDDGYIGTAPASSFMPNGYGLFNMSGNVWEWCEDWFDTRFATRLPNSTTKSSKVLKGGSYLCHRSYCNRYRVAARYANEANTSTGNCGLRCVTSVLI